MAQKFKRRSFIKSSSTIALGLGALHTGLGLARTSRALTQKAGKGVSSRAGTELHFATDYYDDVFYSGRFFNRENLRTLIAFCRSLGTTTIEWVMDDMWALYDSYPGGMDLLRTAVEEAHAAGMRLNVVYKPYEGELSTICLPQSFPTPEGRTHQMDLRGFNPIIRRFNAAHPELCMKRRPGDEDPGGVLRSIRLIKDDAKPVTIRPEDVSVWTSDTNGRFDRYQGSFTLVESSEWRPLFPVGRTCRILTLEGLTITADRRYIEVRFAENAFGGKPFRNEAMALVELINERSQPIPCTPAARGGGVLDGRANVEDMSRPIMLDLIHYGQRPDVRALLADQAAAIAQASEMRDYRAADLQKYALDEKRSLAVARGKLPYHFHMLNPVYPEVRHEWLRQVEFCIERGADGVNFRGSTHGATTGPYGFNEPVLRQLGERPTQAGVRRVIGNAYTEFLREARQLLHAHGRKLGVTLLGDYAQAPDDTGQTPFLDIMDPQWETWVADLADFAVFRGPQGYRWDSLGEVVDRFSNACKAAGIPLVFQANRRLIAPLRRTGPNPDALEHLRREIEYVLSHPGVSAYQVYETATLTKLGDDGRLQEVKEYIDLIRNADFSR
jgi:uncharacterized protein CbrC (UPF0167 family)